MKKLKGNNRLRTIWVIEKGVFICWLVLAFVLYPYSRMSYFSSLDRRHHRVSHFQYRLDMELLFLLELVLMALFFGLKSFAAQRKKDDYQRIICRMKKSKKQDMDEIQLLETLERSYEKKEKEWRIALLCVIAGISIHLIFMVSVFVL